MSDARRTALLDEFYQRYLAEQDASTFATSVAERYCLGTLERLVGSGQRMTRRAAALAIGMLGDFDSNAALGKALGDEDRGVRTMAESGIRTLWCRTGSQRDRRVLAQIIRLNESQKFSDVVRVATELIQAASFMAEAWNQRAIAFFHLRRFPESIRDCAQTLEMNPYHFGAASGMGQCYLQMGNRAGALECFQRALRLNPALEGVRMQIHYLQRTRKGTEGNADR